MKNFKALKIFKKRIFLLTIKNILSDGFISEKLKINQLLF